jgi:hypothetical protein
MLQSCCYAGGVKPTEPSEMTRRVLLLAIIPHSPSYMLVRNGEAAKIMRTSWKI